MIAVLQTHNDIGFNNGTYGTPKPKAELPKVTNADKIRRCSCGCDKFSVQCATYGRYQVSFGDNNVVELNEDYRYETDFTTDLICVKCGKHYRFPSNIPFSFNLEDVMLNGKEA